jgi:hypothetical protein
VTQRNEIKVMEDLLEWNDINRLSYISFTDEIFRNHVWGLFTK